MVKRFVLLMTVGICCFLMTACGPKYPNCKTDRHCERSDQAQVDGRLFCVNGLCQQCRTTEDCGDPALECNAGVCERIPGYCTGDGECPGNQKCRDNRCGPECLDDSECSADRECRGGTCVVRPECAVDADCQDGWSCQGGRCVEPEECRMQAIFFGFDLSTLTDSARSTLQRNADCAQERGLSVTIEGHCDERGTSAYNIALGERRARAAQQYMRQLGVPANRMNIVSYGKERLARDCGIDGPESCHSQNRRAEFRER